MRRVVTAVAVLMVMACGCGSRGGKPKGPVTWLDGKGRQVVTERLRETDELKVTLWDGNTQILKATAKAPPEGVMFKRGSLTVWDKGAELTVLQNDIVVFTGREEVPEKR